ncbi:MAG TPA: hypothetical protein VF902_05005 [Coriobacteriia bacterium]
MSVQTPNGAEFSIAAKILVCAGRVLPPGSGMFSWTSPTGERVSFKTLAETLVITELDWLVEAGYAQIWEAGRKQIIGTMQVLMVRAVHSQAPGFGTRFLEATGWVDTDLYELNRRLMGGSSESPMHGIIEAVADEYRRAGVLHGTAWDPAWRDYLVAQWGREAWDAVQRTNALPWREVARRNVNMASGSLVQRDDD